MSACGPLKAGFEDGEASGSSDEVGTSGESTTESSGADTSEVSTASTDESSETGEPPDACPADPVLGEYDVVLDGKGHYFDFIAEEGYVTWTHTCTVTSHVGSLASGETIGLACTDENAQPIEHTIELRATVEGAPLGVSVVVGQQVELALWVYVWFSGTMTWTLRGSDSELLLLHYLGPYLPAADEEFAAPLEFVAPLVTGVDAEVCPWICDEAQEGNFVPGGECCYRETALRVDLGAGVVQVQHESAGAIPGGGHVIVGHSSATDLGSCNVSDLSGSAYSFTIVR
jgi:hypothetical protein